MSAESSLEKVYFIDPKHFEMSKKLLGKGSFGKVYEGMYYKLPVAVKKIKASDEQAMKDFQNEVQTLM